MIKRVCSNAALSVLLAAGLASGLSQQTPSLGHAADLLTRMSPPLNSTKLSVTSPAFADGTEIPHQNTQYGGNIFPGLRWTQGPAQTRSYLVIVQGQSLTDPKAPTSIHLTITNIPGTVTELKAGLAALPDGASYGPNVHGLNESYVGPHAHPGAKNGYHFQVLALDNVLQVKSGEAFDDLQASIRGHVLAYGEVIGLAEHDAGSPAPTTALPGPVHLNTGLLSGIPGRDVAITAFKGIPYAAPPVGAIRFRSPQPPPMWQGVRVADHFSKWCPQLGDKSTMSEDCLYANVWTGATSSQEHRPVFVWIYGGGFSQGSGSEPAFDGEELARKGVIVVTFNYRIGALGFLATPELSRESGHHASGNAGFEDDIALLHWVQSNIAQFGGDPSNVTIGGQSAGAGSCGFLAISPLAKGLFQRMIAESHVRYSHDTELRFLSVSYRTKANAEAAGQRFAAEHNAPTLKELRALPWDQLILPRTAVDDSVETGSDAKPPIFRPTIDGYVLPLNYSETYARGAQNKVGVLAGNNRDETGAVPEDTFARRREGNAPPPPGSPPVNVTLSAFDAAAKRKFGPLSGEYLKLYPAANDDEAALASNESARENSRISSFLWAIDWTRSVSFPVYTYYWTHRPTGDPGGARHGSEILFAFDNLNQVNQPWTADDRTIAKTLSAYWVNYMTNGNPNGSALPIWPAFAATSPTVMEVGDHFRPIPIASESGITFWKRFFSTQPAW